MAKKADRQRVSSGSLYEDIMGFTRAVRVGNRVLVSGTAPIWPDGSVNLDPKVQARRCFEIISEALAEARAEMRHVVRTRMYITDPEVSEVVGAVHGEFFAEHRPASMMVVVAALLDKRWKVEIEVEAVIDD
ncbi:MAG: RidA family protein [Candidatus Dormiibacterota bacterium]